MTDLRIPRIIITGMALVTAIVLAITFWHWLNASICIPMMTGHGRDCSATMGTMG